MSIIPFSWLKYKEDGNPVCLWPNHISDNIDLNKAIRHKIEFLEKYCTVCKIKVKFQTGKVKLNLRKHVHKLKTSF